MSEWVLLVVGLVAGGAVAWLMASSRASGTIAELRSQIGQHQTALQGRDQEISSLHQQVRTESEQKVAAQTKLEEVQASWDEQRRLLEDAKKHLADAFSALASEALKGNRDEFLALAKGTFEKLQAEAKGELEIRQKAIEGVVQPLKESLDRYERGIQEMERSRHSAYGGLLEQITSLQRVTGSLDVALRGAQAQPRGRWGEVSLRRLSEMAGMSNFCDFTEQETFTGEEGKLRPDMVVHLPGDRDIPVDAKVPLQAFLEATTAVTEDERKNRLEQHCRLVRSHMEKLARSGYRDEFSPAPVVMFLPGESFLGAALEQDRTLLEDGMRRHVLLATPTTLFALLLSVAYGWSQKALEQNAQQISDQGKELYERIKKYLEHFDGVRLGLKKAVESYNSAVGSLESRVLVSARKLKEMGAATGEELEPVEPIEQVPRQLQAPEFSDGK